ncbi:hypothetical protein [Mycolicibacterium smegmatis]|uniref:Uncharacterized protein n=1 Tax=Mycolicibacterium smegmatis TaxID=1772 RepID=A0A653FMS3_MYCSM|nr:hypothetical protein [Mycolicibacterium smegmatis]AIU07993.1 hypothetical protein LJ00_14080 [Mycolicibacterium smegmatis MC2 155]AIU14618.1 hypothetical protein LI99_14085 [Mycolicibacterium smegmatis]AIU21241.1 hypothetical protein LI98_14090 [Mycolicibacterium smegmatis]MBE9621604.1 hypothetical protein [Mycolicibacterium smegmatis]MBE9627999.1 hypothetical protein [Mycolicibacterium smegmatis]
MSNRDASAGSDVFYDVVGAWDDKVLCQCETQRGDQCRRSAQWLVNSHGCERLTMCTQHFHDAVAYLEDFFAEFKGGDCSICGRFFAVFSDFSDTFTAVRL